MNTPFEDDIIDNRRVIDFHTHPYGCWDEFMGMYVQAVLGEHISQREKEMILFENARRLLEIRL